DGTPEWSEAVLCRDPQERLFYKGQWQEGLSPRGGTTPREDEQEARFEALVRRLGTRRDERGRRAFAIPRRLSSQDPAFTELDKLSLRDFLAREGYDSKRLLWQIEYGCRDDFGSSLHETSAWAGLHYYAARMREDGEPAEFLTWPEGNGRLVAVLERAAASRLETGALVFDVAPGGTRENA